MPASPDYRPDPRFPDLGPDYSDAVSAADFPQTVLRFRNDAAAATIGLAGLSETEWLAHFGRFQPLPGQPGPVAMRYHGHQFRTYNPDIGDGRGFLAAQLRDGRGRLLDLGTKGSGQTPWSRRGDGRLTLAQVASLVKVQEVVVREMGGDLQALVERVGWQKACVAMANKNARILWAVLTRDATFDPNHIPEAPAPHCALSQRPAL